MSQINYQKIFNQLKEIIIRNSDTGPYQTLFAWFNKIVFNWSGSDARGVNSDIEDTDSGVEEAILQMDSLNLEDDADDNPPANIDSDKGGFGLVQEVIYPFPILIYSTLLINIPKSYPLIGMMLQNIKLIRY